MNQQQPEAQDDIVYDDTKFPHHEEWLKVYEQVKCFCNFPLAIEFMNQHPHTINYRKGGKKRNTILHQAAFWGVDSGILEQLLELGAMPYLKNFKDQTPYKLIMEETKNNEAAKNMRDVFGDTEEYRQPQEIMNQLENQLIELHSEDFANLTRELSITELSYLCKHACFRGDFALVVALYKEFPFLAKHQSVASGWTGLHQAGYHGVSLSLYRRLIELGVPQELVTYDGMSWIAVAVKEHPKYKHAPEQFQEFTDKLLNQDNINNKKFSVGDLVRISRADLNGAVLGSIVSINQKDITIREKKVIKKEEAEMIWFGQEGANNDNNLQNNDDGTEDMKFYTGPSWRVQHVIVHDDEGDYDEKMKELLVECCTCQSYVLPTKASPACNQEHQPHFYCSECLANALWASWTNQQVPLLCQFCKAEIDLDSLRKQRGVVAKFNQTQNINFHEFQKNVHKKITEIKGDPISWDTLDEETRNLYEKQIQDGELMRCLNDECGQPFTKVQGCSWVRCFFCKTEHCWNTKQLAGIGPGKCGGGHGCHY